jgi:DTW domain-containing protein YfiP
MLKSLSLSPFSPLTSKSQRSPCPQCNKTRQWFCYDCLVPLIDTDDTPQVALPINLTIVRHASEPPSKSSVVPLSMVVDSSQLQFIKFHPITYPVIDWTALNINSNNTVILYPTDDAVNVEDITDWSEIQNLVVIDCTWFQVNTVLEGLLNSSADSPKFKFVKISNHKTEFWRYQYQQKDHHLSTVEAVYWFYREMQGKRETKEFDDLLWFYAFIHQMVHQKSTSRRLPKHQSQK